MSGNEKRIDDLLGSDAIVGLTYLEASGEVREVVELHGVIAAIDGDAVTLELVDGELFTLPPDPEAFFAAPPGEYRMKPSGELVTDPSWMAGWKIQEPPAGPPG